MVWVSEEGRGVTLTITGSSMNRWSTFRSHLWISFSPKRRRKLHVAPFGLAEVVGSGVNLSCHVEDVHSILGDHCSGNNRISGNM